MRYVRGREEGNTWLTAGGKRAVLSTQRAAGYDAIMQWQQNGGSHVIRVGRWCIVFLPARSESGTGSEKWALRVERLPTLPTRDRTRGTADFLLLMGGQDGLVWDV